MVLVPEGGVRVYVPVTSRIGGRHLAVCYNAIRADRSDGRVSTAIPITVQVIAGFGKALPVAENGCGISYPHGSLSLASW